MHSFKKRIAALFSKTPKGQKGFTLVEMIIVIALAAVVIGMLFSVLGDYYTQGTTKSAAGKSVDDLNTISTAAQTYKIDKAAEMTTAGVAGVTALVTAQYLTQAPVAPNPFSTADYEIDTTTYTQWGTVAADTTATLTAANTLLTTEVCAKVNELFAGAAAGAVPAAAPVGTKDVQCVGAAGGPYTIVKPIYKH